MVVSLTNLSHQILQAKLFFSWEQVSVAVTVNRKTISECAKPKGKRVGRLLAFHIQRHPPTRPASQPRVDKCIWRLLPRCKGWGQGGLQKAPEQRRLQGPEPRSPAASRLD